VNRAILISFPNWLGDAVLATGLLAALARLREPPIVDVSGNRTALAVAKDHPVVRRTILYEKRGAHRRPGPALALAAELKQAGYAAHVTLPSTPSAALFARLVAAPVRTGFDGFGRRLGYTHRYRRRRRGSEHLLAEYQALLALAVPEAPPAEPEVVVTAAARARAATLTGPGPYAALASGATFGPAKRWPAERFAAAGRALAVERGLRTVLVGGPGDRAVADEVAAALPDAVNLCGQTDVPALAAVLAGAAVVIANDSGPMHLARAVGAPTIGIFGSTEPRWTAPRGGRVVIAAERPPCAPCYRHSCAIGYICLTRIPVADVVAAAKEEAGS
jgi:heptosyltransferase-2